MEILDPELSVRLGSLNSEATASLEEIATREFIAGLSQMQALDLARAIHWLKVGKRADCTSVSMIVDLALREIPEKRLEFLVADLDTAYTLTLRRHLEELRIASPKRREVVLLGWRIFLAIELLRQHGN